MQVHSCIVSIIKKGEMIMLNFIFGIVIGFLSGGIIGFIISTLAIASSRYNERIEKEKENKR